MKEFRKRVYTLRNFLRDLAMLIFHSHDFLKTAQKKQISSAFREKIMVAVSNVLGCKYCSWLHTEMALREGVDGKEIKKILAWEIGDFPENEAIALAFAQHYSESYGRPKGALQKRFFDYYGEEMAKDILNYIRAIYWGNLAGNTVEAFIYRLRGKPVERGSFFSEFLVFLITAPYFLIIVPLIVFVLKNR